MSSSQPSTKRLRRFAMTAAAVIGMTGVLAGGPTRAMAAEPLGLQVTPAAGAWFTDVSIKGTGCKGAADAKLMVNGAVHRLNGQAPLQLGNFATNPAADGSWSVAIVVTHTGGNPLTGEGGPATPGPYEVRARCGPVTVVEPGSGEPYAGEPYVATYKEPFQVLPGGPTPKMTVAESTVTITDGKAPVTVSGDLCRRPDGASTGMALLDLKNAPENQRNYTAGYFFTASADGHWSGTMEPSSDVPPAPGVYQVMGECWLGTNGQESGNGFAYEPLTVTLVAGTGSPTTTTPAAPAGPPAATPVPATPAFTG